MGSGCSKCKNDSKNSDDIFDVYGQNEKYAPRATKKPSTEGVSPKLNGLKTQLSRSQSKEKEPRGAFWQDLWKKIRLHSD